MAIIRNYAINRLFVNQPGMLPIDGSSWFVSPSSNPSFQVGMDNFSPRTISGTANPSAPIISRISSRSRPGGVISVTGHQFDDLMQLWIYSEANSINNMLQATLIPGSRIGNKAKYQINPSSISNAFMLAWLYHPTYGWSDPYPINAPEVHTLHTSFYGFRSRSTYGVIARNGMSDQIRVGGKNLSSKQSTEKCWCYLQPTGGGSGNWVAADSVNEARAMFTLPALSNGTYEVWIHTGRGGTYGWAKSPYNLTVEAADSLGADKTAASPSGGDDSTTLQTLINTISANTGAYVQLQSGTYTIGTALSVARGLGYVAHFRGQSDGTTTLKASGNNSFFSGNAGQWLEKITFDVTNWNNSVSSGGIASAAYRIIDCTVLSTTGAFSSFSSGGLAAGTGYRISGCTFSIAQNGYGATALVGGWMSDTTLINNNTGEGGIYTNGGKNNVALDNVTFKDLGDSNTGGGRAYIAEYGNKGLSIVGCTTSSLKVSGDQNRGEQVLIDGGYIRYAYYANGGTANTIQIGPIDNGTLQARTTTGSSSNATSSLPTLVFTNVQNATIISYVDIIGGTNAIPGRYLIASRGTNFVTLTGSIGTSTSISSVTANGLSFYGTAKTLSSSNANTSTPTVSGGSFTSSDVGTPLCFLGSGGAIPTWARISSVSAPNAVLDRAISGSATISAAIANQVTNFSPGTNGGNGDYTVAVVGGKGEGQFANIAGYSVVGTDLTLTLDRSWRVTTDSTSFVKLAFAFIDAHVYGCTFSGDGTQVTSNNGASCGIEAFESNTNITFRNNLVSGLHYGVVDWAYNANQNQASWSIWNDFSSSTYSNCGFGSRLWSSAADYGQSFVMGFTTHEDIAVIGTSDQSSPLRTAQFWIASWDSANETTINSYLVSGNSAYGINSQSNTGGTLWCIGSSISLGGGTFTGSRIQTSGSSLTINQYNPGSGQFTGFQS